MVASHGLHPSEVIQIFQISDYIRVSAVELENNG